VRAHEVQKPDPNNLTVELRNKRAQTPVVRHYTAPYKINQNVVHSCKYHVIWCPKYRRAVLVEGVEERLKEIIRAVANERQSEILELDIMPDHVQLLVEIDPQFGIHRLIKLMKGRSSRLIRSEFSWIKSRLPTLWTNSYFVSTVGRLSREAVRIYLDQQKHI
jgi:putative transposase